MQRAAVPLVALLAAHLAQAGEAPAAPAEPAPVPTTHGAPPTESASATPSPPGINPAGPTRIPVPLPGSTADEPATWSSQLLAPLRHFGVESWWDVVRFEPWSASLGLTFDNQEQRITAPNSADQRFASRLASEAFSIRNDGVSILDRRLFTAGVGLGFTLQQAWQHTTDTQTKQHGTLANYFFDGTFLPESAYNVNLVAVRTQTSYVLPSGTTTHSDIRNEGITLRVLEDNILRDREILPYFSANVRLLDQRNQQTTSTAGQTFRQDDRRDLFALDVQNGTETSDLAFQYQYAKLDNYAYSEGSYRSQSANIVYSRDFGPTLNWRSDSRLNYYTRAGTTRDSDMSTLEANEFLSIDHNQDLSTNYNYQLTRQGTSFGNSTTQSGGVQVNYQVYRNFGVGGGLTGVYSSLPDGSISSFGASGNVNYSHVLPWEGQLSINGGGGYLVTSTSVQGGVVQVTDAPYAVPQDIGAGSSIVLRDRNIQPDSIVVVVLKSGTRVIAVVGVDYALRVDGDRTSIVPQPTSALMAPGDPLNVSYAYLVAPDSKFAAVSNSASISADWSWFGLSVSHDQSDQKPLAGGDRTLLVNERRDTGTVYLSGRWEDFEARAGANFIRYDSSRLAYDEARLDQMLSWRLFGNIQLSLSANEYRTQHRLPEHTTTGNAVRADAQWNLGAWLTTWYAGRRAYRDTQQAPETVTEAGVRIRRSWTKLDLSFAAAMQQRERGDVKSTNGIVHFGAVRRF